MQTEKAAIALILITIGMFMIDYAAIKMNLGIKNPALSGTFAVFSFFITIIFGVSVVYILQYL